MLTLSPPFVRPRRYIITYDSFVPGDGLFTDTTFTKPDMTCTGFGDSGLTMQGAGPLLEGDSEADAEFDSFAQKYQRQYEYVAAGSVYCAMGSGLAESRAH